MLEGFEPLIYNLRFRPHNNVFKDMFINSAVSTLISGFVIIYISTTNYISDVINKSCDNITNSVYDSYIEDIISGYNYIICNIILLLGK